MKELHHLSLATAPTQVFNAQGTRVSTATSFFYEAKDSRLFLITNWHVVTGRSPRNPSCSETGAVPHVLKIKLHNRQDKVGGRRSIVTSDISEFSIPINSEDGDAPQWLEHPKHKLKVDVVGIEIEKRTQFREAYAINMVNKWGEYHEGYEPEVMDDVFVIGYPWGLSSTAGRGGGLPVYKRGCIASDPIVDFRRLPCVLIDCRTTKAMSGSPVIASRTGIYMPDGQMSGDTVIGTVTKLLGVYAGRLTEGEAAEGYEENVSEIGIVWKASVLEAITERGVQGTALRELARY